MDDLTKKPTDSITFSNLLPVSTCLEFAACTSNMASRFGWTNHDRVVPVVLKDDFTTARSKHWVLYQVQGGTLLCSLEVHCSALLVSVAAFHWSWQQHNWILVELSWSNGVKMIKHRERLRKWQHCGMSLYHIFSNSPRVCIMMCSVTVTVKWLHKSCFWLAAFTSDGSLQSSPAATESLTLLHLYGREADPKCWGDKTFCCLCT